MKYIYFVVVIFMLLFIGCENKPSIPNPLDLKKDGCTTLHQGHVKVLTNDEFITDDGRQIKLYFTGGTGAHLNSGDTGILTISTPDYYCGEGEGTYFFHSFKKDVIK